MTANDNNKPVYYVKRTVPRINQITIELRGSSMEWKPIETAPKDGAWVLVFGDIEDEGAERNIAVAQYTNYRNGSTLNKYWWQFAWYDGGYYGEADNITHWMPLPTPPKDKP